MEKTITIEAKIDNRNNLYSDLDDFGRFYGYLERTLFNELANAIFIDNNFRKNLKKQYIAQYQIHARLFNVLWNEVKGKIDSQKELDKFNRRQIEQKVKSYEKKIANTEKYLKRGFKKARMNPLKPNERQQLEHNLVQYKNVIHKLKNKLDKSFKPHMVFGGAKFHKSQWRDECYVNNHQAWKKEWNRRRNGHFSFIGSKDETNGNQLCQYQNDKGTLRITLPYCFKGKNLEFPVNFVSSDWNTNQQYYNYFHEAVRNKQALSYKFIKKENSQWYVQVSFTIYGEAKPSLNGTIGVDFNYNLIATTEIDRFGNFIKVKNYKYDSEDLTTNQSDDFMSKIVHDIVERAKNDGKSLSIEKLDLKKCKSGNAKFVNRKVNLLQYSQFREKMEVKCVKENIWLSQVNPAYTSIIGRYKYAKRHGISTHNAAAMVIARRSSNFKDRIPNQICRVLQSEENEFERIQSTRHHWSHWAFVSKNLETCLKKFNSCTGLSCTVNNLISRFNPADYVVHRQVGTELKLVSFGNFI